MATLDAIKTRIILEIDRDDLGPGGEAEQALTDAIADAIDHFSDQPFWFNRANGTATTSTGIATLAKPDGVRFAEVIAHDGEALQKVPFGDIAYRTETGVPSRWAAGEESIRLWPVPDAAYAIEVHGLADIGVPASGAESNVWTTEAARLIVAQAKATLFRMFKDYDAMQAAQAEEAEALSRLRGETRQRGASPLRSDLPSLRPMFSIAGG